MAISSVNPQNYPVAKPQKHTHRSIVGVITGSIGAAGTLAYCIKSYKDPTMKLLSGTNAGIISSILILLGYTADRYIDIKNSNKTKPTK